MTNIEIDDIVAVIRELEAKSEDIGKQINELKDELKKELDTRKEDSMETDLHKVFYSCYEKKSVDTDKLKAAGLYDTYCKESTVVSFKITNIKQK